MFLNKMFRTVDCKQNQIDSMEFVSQLCENAAEAIHMLVGVDDAKRANHKIQEAMMIANSAIARRV